MQNESNKIDPEVKKAIWKVIVYAVSVFAALFAGNVSAKCGIRFFSKPVSQISISQTLSSDSVNAEFQKL